MIKIEPKLLEAVFKEEWARYQPNPDPEYTNVPFKIDSIEVYESVYHKNYVQNTMITIRGTARDNRNWDMEVNLYQLIHNNLKEWAKSNNVLDRIDWSDNTDNILLTAGELLNEINRRSRSHKRKT